MKSNFLLYLLLIVALMNCTNREAESIIEGSWEGKFIQLENDQSNHALPDGITMEFEYPRYKFEGELEEQGNYYIKDEKLHLIPDDRDEKRELNIRQLSQDSLRLHLIDTLGQREVLFIRQ